MQKAAQSAFKWLKITTNISKRSIRLNQPISFNNQSNALRTPFKTRVINVSEINYAYDKAARIILQFDTSPLIDTSSLNGSPQLSLDLQWLNDANPSSHQKLIDKLNCLSNYCHERKVSITSTEFDVFIDILTNRMHDFNENEVIATLQIFAGMPNDNMKLGERNFHELWQAIDESCARSSMEWDTDQRLAICSIWSIIPMARKSKFTQMVCNKFKQDLDVLSGKQMAAAVRFMNDTAQFIVDYRVFERNFNRVLDDLTIIDIGRMCYVFSRDNFRIHKSELIHRILSRLVGENIDAIADNALKKILQTIRISVRATQHSQIKELVEQLRLQINRRPLSTCVRFIGIAEIFYDYDPIIMENILKRATIDASDLSFFDYSDICKALVMSNYKSPTGQDQIFLEILLQRIRERVRYVQTSARGFSCLVYYLAILGWHDAEIIQNALRDDFLLVAYKRPQFLINEIYGLNVFAQLNLNGNYQGNLLNKKYHKKMKKIMENASEIKTHSKTFGTPKMLKMLMEILDAANLSYKLGFALPQYPIADLYLVYDKAAGSIVNVEQRFPDAFTGKFSRKEDFVGSDTNLVVIALIASYWSDLCRTDLSPNGFMKLKIDQMKLLGFKPLLINHSLWISLEEDEKPIYVQKALGTIIEQS